MDSYVTGKTIKSLRESKKMTQKELAEKLCLSDKTVSKWETNRGLPDITLLEPLAQALEVSLTELISGTCMKNTNQSANMRRSLLYVCPVCGNVVWAAGNASFSCCGVNLLPLEKEEAGSPEEEHHSINMEQVENEWYVTVDHPMTKEHYISFIAFVASDKVELVKLYPEQNAEARFTRRGHGDMYIYCNHHGLFSRRI